jgi:lipoic acid synthetase
MTKGEQGEAKDWSVVDSVRVFHLGTMEYEKARRLQEDIAVARARGAIGDVLLLLGHPPVITIGRGGGEEDILAPDALLRRAGVRVLLTDRGGRATYHGPGQLVAYPILEPPGGDLHRHVWRLEEVVIRVLDTYGLTGGRVAEHPGVWVECPMQSGCPGKKIAAVGIAVRDGVTRHGLALNVSPNLAHFELLIPCGIANREVTSMARELGWVPDLTEVVERFVQAFGEVFECQPERSPGGVVRRLETPAEQPHWLWRRVSVGAEAAVDRMENLLGGLQLHTVCQEAHCPNIAECFGRGTATFMILGDTCTRNCRFCAVSHGRPAPVDPEEPERVAEAATRLGLRHVVITSVTRDDLPNGGASQFAATVCAVRRRLPGATVEVLIPDLGGSRAALETVLASEPDVLNHNLETVPRLYPRVRPQAEYRRSLGVLACAKAHASKTVTKSGLMLGLGERTAEVLRVLYHLRRARCDLLTLGQYLQPTDRHLPVRRYVPPAEFGWYEDKCRALGFQGVAAGPLVRSSYHAEALWQGQREAADPHMQPVQA